jgi:hypothetical protein
MQLRNLFTWLFRLQTETLNQSKASNLHVQFHSVPMRFGLARGHLQQNMSEQNEIVHVSWKLWIDFMCIMHGTSDIKNRNSSFLFMDVKSGFSF